MALIVTIIVLLILAGISISMLTGDNGIIHKAVEASKNTIIGTEKEAIALAYNSVMIDNLGEGVTAKELENALIADGNKDASVTGSTTLKVTFSNSGNVYNVKADGTITLRTPEDEAADNEIIQVLTPKIALTAAGKIVSITEANFTDQWQEITVTGELEKLNGIKKVVGGEKGTSFWIIDDNGEVYAIGYNTYGQLGIGNTVDQENLVKIEGLTNIEDIYTNESLDVVIAKDATGNLYAWGRNYIGQLGIGNTEDQTSPVKITGLTNIEEVYVGYSSVIAKDKNGNLYAWGDNLDGGLGIGNTEDQTSPVKITGLTNIEEVYIASHTGEAGVIAKDRNGNLYAWGNNESGQLGIGDVEQQNVPIKIQGLNSIEEVYMKQQGRGEVNTFAIDINGNLYTWGSKQRGILGIETETDQTTPVKIEGLSNIKNVYCKTNDFDAAIIAKDSDGNLYTWGSNILGELGIGNTDWQDTPVKIEGLSNIEDVEIRLSGEGTSVLAKDDKGNLYVWGSNQTGQIGLDKDGDIQTTPICLNEQKDVLLYQHQVKNIMYLYRNSYNLNYITTDDGKCYLLQAEAWAYIS